ncbi:hypothetical protein [Thalassotalea sp. PLHSN55]|uniref:hypothetical protein n=1 Tax=Thalassotalea sp. PLHSN55 TaxID=3435888 RepID=UPI003F8695BA
MKLNKREKEAFVFLKNLADCYLNGTSPDVNETDFNKLQEIGITIRRINHREVKTIFRGKNLKISRLITNAPWYIRGRYTYEYLPFQIKEYKKS